MTSYVLRIIKNIRLKIKNQELLLGELTTEDIKFAASQIHI